MRATLGRIVITVAVLAASAAAPTAVRAQNVSGCYVPTVGAFYIIKQTGLPAACLETTHTEVSLVGPASLGWSLAGNTGNTASSFLGTTDGAPITFKVNDTQVAMMRLTPYAGRATPVPSFGVGTPTPFYPLHVEMEQGSLRVHPIFGEFDGTTLLGEWRGTTHAPQVRYESPADGFIDIGLNATGDWVIEAIDKPRFVLQTVANGAATLNSDDAGNPIDATAANEFAVRATGGVRLRTNADLSTGCNLAAGSGAWACTSSRAAKADFESIDAEQVLAGIASLPIQRWSYAGSDSATRHIGPFAEDFHKAFGVGQGPSTISTVDADGVSLLGIKALEARTRKLENENAELRARLAALETLLKGGAPDR